MHIRSTQNKGEETTLQELSDDPVHTMFYLALTQGDSSGNIGKEFEILPSQSVAKLSAYSSKPTIQGSPFISFLGSEILFRCYCCLVTKQCPALLQPPGL